MEAGIALMKTLDTSLGGQQKEFPKTSWDALCRAQNSDAGTRREGLEELCRKYWKPVYHFIRVAWAKTNEDAKDLTQAFLLWLSEGEVLRRYRPEQASFRAYLKGLLKNFVRNQEDALGRLKRGGGLRILELDGSHALPELLADPATPDPGAAFDESWRNELVARALARVRDRLESKGRGLQFQVYASYELVPSSERPSYAELAGRFGLKEKDVDNHLLAVREYLRSEVRREIERLTSRTDDLESEWDALFGR